jgi:hypothetical protein
VVIHSGPVDVAGGEGARAVVFGYEIPVVVDGVGRHAVEGALDLAIARIASEAG